MGLVFVVRVSKCTEAQLTYAAGGRKEAFLAVHGHGGSAGCCPENPVHLSPVTPPPHCGSSAAAVPPAWG